MKLDDRRYEELKDIVASMFEIFDVRCVPINCFEIADKMGVKLIPYSSFSKRKQQVLKDKSIDGFSTLDSDGVFKIFYNDEQPYERRQNTIMHEIGHILLDHSEDSDLAEAEVKFFAKFALAPPVLVHKFKCKNYLDIARIFEISLEASLYAWNYYQKWLKHASGKYLSCDLRIWRQVQENIS